MLTSYRSRLLATSLLGTMLAARAAVTLSPQHAVTTPESQSPLPEWLRLIADRGLPKMLGIELLEVSGTRVVAPSGVVAVTTVLEVVSTIANTPGDTGASGTV